MPPNTNTDTKTDGERAMTIINSSKTATTAPQPPIKGNLKKPPAPHPGAGSQLLTPAQLKLLQQEELGVGVEQQSGSPKTANREAADASSPLKKPLDDDLAAEKKSKKSPRNNSPMSKSSKGIKRDGGSRSPTRRRKQSPKSSRSVIAREVHNGKLSPPLTSQSLPPSSSPSSSIVSNNSDVTEKVRSRTHIPNGTGANGGRQMKSVRRIRPVASTTAPSSASLLDNSDAAIKRRAARAQRITTRIPISPDQQEGEISPKPGMKGVSRSPPRSMAVASLPTVEDEEVYGEEQQYSSGRCGSLTKSVRSLSPPPHRTSNNIDHQHHHHDVEAQQKQQEQQFTPSTQPGAVAYFPSNGDDDDLFGRDGGSFVVNRSSNSSNKLRDDTEDKDDTEKRIAMEPPPTLPPPSSSPSSSQQRQHPVAEMIDDAEPVVYAKDVQEDDRDFKRRVIVFCILICSVVIVVVSVVAVVVTNNNKNEETVDPYADLHPQCQILMRNDDVIDNSQNPKTPIRQCFCNGVIDEHFLNEHFTEEKVQFYQRWIEESPLIRSLMRENHALYDKNGNEIPMEVGTNVTTCHPLHQTVLVNALARSRAQVDIQDWEVPLYIVDNMLFVTYFYITFDGLNWKDQHGWFSDTDPCNWHGIGCTFVDALTRLSLAHNQLRGNMTWTKFWWRRGAPDLRLLDLSRNTEVYGNIPDDLMFQSTTLDMMLLEGASLGGGPLPEWGNRPLNPRMDRLLLTSNQYTGTIPNDWFQLFPAPSSSPPSSPPAGMPSQRGRSVRLRSLGVSFNQLSGTIPTEIGLASNLNDILIRSNQINGTLPTEMANLQNLEVLDLGNNSLHGTIPEFLGHLTKLNMLNLFESGLTGNIPESFCDNSSSSSSSFTNTFNNNNNDTAINNFNNGPGRSRRIFMSCENIKPCSCCGDRADMDVQVRMLCSEQMPDFVMDDEI